MRTLPAHAAIAAAAALLVAAASGGAGTVTRPLQKRTRWPVEALAMDGPRVAYDVGADYAAHRTCNTIFVWNVITRSTKRVSGVKTCAADNTSTGAGVRELALASGRAAWIVNQGGNTESADYLYTASLPRPRERQLARAVRTGPVDSALAGAWIGGLVGGGEYLGVNRWVTNSLGRPTSARLETIAGRLRAIANGTQTLRAQSTDGRQIAVVRSDGSGSVALYSTHGRLLRVVTRPSATEVAVRGDYLAVLNTDDTLAVYNSHSGRLLHTWRVAHGARSLDVSSGLAAYASPRAGGGDARVVHILGLASGRDRVLATTPPQLVAVQLEPAGLVYAVNRTGARASAYLVFTPMRRLPR